MTGSESKYSRLRALAPLSEGFNVPAFSLVPLDLIESFHDHTPRVQSHIEGLREDLLAAARGDLGIAFFLNRNRFPLSEYRDRLGGFLSDHSERLRTAAPEDLGEGWAVRSSYVEDLDVFSNAGAFHSRLGVRPDGLADAVADVLANYHNPRCYARLLNYAQTLEPDDREALVARLELELGRRDYEVMVQQIPLPIDGGGRAASEALVLPQSLLCSIVEKMGRLEDFSEIRRLDTEWYVSSRRGGVSMVAFNHDPASDERCCVLTSSSGVGSVVSGMSPTLCTYYFYAPDAIFVETAAAAVGRLGSDDVAEPYLVQYRSAGPATGRGEQRVVDRSRLPEDVVGFRAETLTAGDVVAGRLLVSPTLQQALRVYEEGMLTRGPALAAVVSTEGSKLDHPALIFGQSRISVLRAGPEVWRALEERSRGRQNIFVASPHDGFIYHSPRREALDRLALIPVDAGPSASADLYRLGAVEGEAGARLSSAEAAALMEDYAAVRDTRPERSGSEARAVAPASLKAVLSPRSVAYVERAEANRPDDAPGPDRLALLLLLRPGVGWPFVHRLTDTVAATVAERALRLVGSTAGELADGEGTGRVAETILAAYGSEEQDAARIALSGLLVDLCSGSSGLRKLLSERVPVGSDPLSCTLRLAAATGVGLELAFGWVSEVGGDVLDSLLGWNLGRVVPALDRAGELAFRVPALVEALRAIEEDFLTSESFVPRLETVLNRWLDEGGRCGEETVATLAALLVFLRTHADRDAVSRLLEAAEAAASAEDADAGFVSSPLTRSFLELDRSGRSLELDALARLVRVVRQADAGSRQDGVFSERTRDVLLFNLLDLYIDQSDLVCKGYAESLARIDSEEYRRYLDRLAIWYGFVAEILLDPTSEFHRTLDGYVRSHLENLRRRPDYRMALGYESTWKRRIFEGWVDVPNIHQLHNDIHQGTLHLKQDRLGVTWGGFAQRLLETANTFSSRFNPILTCTLDRVELELGLTIHKSSATLSADGWFFTYVEPPSSRHTYRGRIGRLRVFEYVLAFLNRRQDEVDYSSEIFLFLGDAGMNINARMRRGSRSAELAMDVFWTMLAVFDSSYQLSGEPEELVAHLEERLAADSVYSKLLEAIFAYRRQLDYRYYNAKLQRNRYSVCLAHMASYREMFDFLDELPAGGYDAFVDGVDRYVEDRRLHPSSNEHRTLAFVATALYPEQVFADLTAGGRRGKLSRPSLALHLYGRSDYFDRRAELLQERSDTGPGAWAELANSNPSKTIELVRQNPDLLEVIVGLEQRRKTLTTYFRRCLYGYYLDLYLREDSGLSTRGVASYLRKLADRGAPLRLDRGCYETIRDTDPGRFEPGLLAVVGSLPKVDVRFTERSVLE